MSTDDDDQHEVTLRRNFILVHAGTLLIMLQFHTISCILNVSNCTSVAGLQRKRTFLLPLAERE
jgi:hypothetical protein